MTHFTRAQWGAAKPTRTLTRLNPRDVTHFVVHFDGSSPIGLRDPRALLRAFQRFHQGKRGFADIAYNSAVFQTGDSAEGRGPYVGGHLRGAQNARAWGCMAAIGNGERPTEALWVALAEEYERACKWAGKTLIVNGHTDWPDANKACPGPYLLAGIKAGRLRRIPTTPTPITTVPEEDIMATTDELRQIIREELHALMAGTIPVSAGTDRAWTSTRDAALAEAAELGKVRLPDGEVVRTDDVLGELAQFLAEVKGAGEDEIRKTGV